jgi:iron complex transport system substrate-binding protein
MGTMKMKTMNNLAVYVLLIFTGFYGCSKPEQFNQITPARIISLAPSITETLFALGLGDKVVGVTNYCHYPPATESIERIGGYTDANLEKILSLEPDLVILQKEHEKQRSFLQRYGLTTLAVDFSTIKNICHSFEIIGKKCGAEKEADSLVLCFAPLLHSDTSTAPRPKVLLCVGRDSPGGGTVKSVYAAGAGTFYNSLIEAAGAVNAFVDTIPHYPKLSMEGIITVAPDIIIDVAPAMGDYVCTTLVADWKSAAMIPAVDKNRVYCLAADYATVLGPRVLKLFSDIREMIGEAE